MSRVLTNPRSALHALKPIGCGSADVESLLGYICRLSVSHSVSVASLARTVANAIGVELRDGFDWHERNLSGIGEAAQTWASGVSALTGVAQLDRLTLVPWRDVVASSALAATRGRWCPECFAEDRDSGKVPYFRLSWDVGAVTVCNTHRTRLLNVCPECGRSGARHKATYVVPGWCAHCGAFLGNDQGESDRQSGSPEAFWVARQVGLLLSAQGSLESAPNRKVLYDAIRELVTRLDHGKSALFARRIGFAKATVHNWLQAGGLPTLGASLRIALHAGLPLPKLLVGNLDGWVPPQEPVQMDLGLFASSSKRVQARELDWEAIRAELIRFAALPMPISVAEAGRRLAVDVRHLYLQANKESRVLGDRWKCHMKIRGEDSQATARVEIAAACQTLIAEGRAINLREVERLVPREVLGSVERLFDMLHDIKRELDEH